MNFFKYFFRQSVSLVFVLLRVGEAPRETSEIEKNSFEGGGLREKANFFSGKTQFFLRLLGKLFFSSLLKLQQQIFLFRPSVYYSLFES
jgi:hypothetical protein